MNTFDLDSFFPKEKLQLIKAEQTNDIIHIYLKSKTKSCVCPKCGQSTEEYHGTYVRHVQDLPILGKNVQLHIKAHEYKCTNTDCNASTIAENFNGFLNYYSRMTERCADFICSLALETSCEGCSRICKVLGIKISGDTVIRLLLKRYQAMEHDFTGDKIGIDDFAYKKRHTYGTIIVDEETHNPITLLDGRDGDALRKWLKNNKHGVTTGPNDWNTSKTSCYGISVKGTTVDEDNEASNWCYRQLGKPYNYNYFNVSTRKKFYCSQLVWAAFKDNYGIDLDTSDFGDAVHPMELVNSSKTYTIYKK